MKLSINAISCCFDSKSSPGLNLLANFCFWIFMSLLLQVGNEKFLKCMLLSVHFGIAWKTGFWSCEKRLFWPKNDCFDLKTGFWPKIGFLTKKSSFCPKTCFFKNQHSFNSIDFGRIPTFPHTSTCWLAVLPLIYARAMGRGMCPVLISVYCILISNLNHAHSTRKLLGLTSARSFDRK